MVTFLHLIEMVKRGRVMKRYVLGLFFLVFLISCSTPTKTPVKKVVIDANTYTTYEEVPIKNDQNIFEKIFFGSKQKTQIRSTTHATIPSPKPKLPK